MPRILIDVSEAWVVRYQTGVVDVLDTLQGLSLQIEQAISLEPEDSRQKLELIAEQMLTLRRNVESWRLMF